MTICGQRMLAWRAGTRSASSESFLKHASNGITTVSNDERYTLVEIDFSLFLHVLFVLRVLDWFFHYRIPPFTGVTFHPLYMSLHLLGLSLHPTQNLSYSQDSHCATERTLQ